MELQNNLENPYILTPEILKTIDLITSRMPNAIFGGSICLNALDLIKRPIKDIDLIVPVDTSVKLINDIVVYDSNSISEVCNEDANGCPIRRIAVKINNINVCIFKIYEPIFFLFNFFDKRIKLHNVGDIIQIKKKYINNPNIKPESLKKHTNDLNEIQNFFNNNF